MQTMTDVEGERVYVSIAKKRKRCPQCGTMVEAGERAVYRAFSKVSWGFQRGGFIGEGRTPRTHAYHPACAAIAPELAGRVPK